MPVKPAATRGATTPGATTPGVRRVLSTEDRFARIVEASPAAQVLVGPAGSIEMVNRQVELMFGYDRTDLMARPIEMLLPALPSPEYKGLRNDILVNRTTRQMGEAPCPVGRRRDGTEFPLEIGLNPIELDGKKMVLAAMIDTSARRRIDVEKEEQRAELARSNADLEEFAYVASHDLKAPLRAISHLVEWIGDDVGPAASAETSDNLRLLRGRVMRLQVLLDGLLAWSRVGRTDVRFEDIDVPDMVRDIASVLSPPAGFAIDCDETMPSLRTDRTALLGVLQNLISNGLKHHDRGEGRISVAMRLADGIAEFRVSDDGPGILPRFHERIFVIFQTLESRDDVDTSGIGLAIVKKRVEGHGGRVWVESAPPERGTTIAFTWKEPIA